MHEDLKTILVMAYQTLMSQYFSTGGQACSSQSPVIGCSVYSGDARQRTAAGPSKWLDRDCHSDFVTNRKSAVFLLRSERAS
jgi:hypothetical protein